jgi:hypothetical protein
MSGRRETLYRVMYESFTPKMMHRTPLWLKKRIATTLGWRLVRTLDADAWLRKLFTEKPGEPAPIAISMFESCAAGVGVRWTFLNRRWLWRQGKTYLDRRQAAAGDEIGAVRPDHGSATTESAGNAAPRGREHGNGDGPEAVSMNHSDITLILPGAEVFAWRG